MTIVSVVEPSPIVNLGKDVEVKPSLGLPEKISNDISSSAFEITLAPELLQINFTLDELFGSISAVMSILWLFMIFFNCFSYFFFFFVLYFFLKFFFDFFYFFINFFFFFSLLK